jgi:hypothetical protein
MPNIGIEEGSFADRLKKLTLSPLQLLKVLWEEVNNVTVKRQLREGLKHFDFSP